MQERIWNDGPPPFVGWWNARWRWWDGKTWSGSAGSSWDEVQILNPPAFRMPPQRSSLIQWTDYYPDNARVPRIDPTTPLEVRADKVAAWAREGWLDFVTSQKIHPSTPVIVTLQVQVQI